MRLQAARFYVQAVRVYRRSGEKRLRAVWTPRGLRTKATGIKFYLLKRVVSCTWKVSAHDPVPFRRLPRSLWRLPLLLWRLPLLLWRLPVRCRPLPHRRSFWPGRHLPLPHVPEGVRLVGRTARFGADEKPDVDARCASGFPVVQHCRARLLQRLRHAVLHAGKGRPQLRNRYRHVG